MKVKLSDIIDAMEETSQDSEFFLDKENGEIVWLNDMIMERDEFEEISKLLDEHGCCRLPTSMEIHDYDIMVDFVNAQSGEVFDRLASAIKGRGAFRRFRETLSWFGKEQDWYDFKAAAYKGIAIRWCEENDIEFDE